MTYLGDFAAGASVYCKFSTNAAAGSRVDFSNALEAADIRVYKNGSTTERSSTAGFTVTSGFDSMVGVHHVTLDLSDNTDAGFYAAGSDYQIVLYPDETVDSLSVAAVVGHFSIEARSALRPTTSGRTLDVAANGALDTDSMTAIAAAVWTDIRAGYKGTGTAAGGGASSIILAAGAGAALDVKAGDFIEVSIDGVSDGNVVQSISTDTCTMEGPWGGGISPDADDTYYIYAGGSGVTTAAVATAVRTEMDSNSTELAKIGTPVVDLAADIADVGGTANDLQTRLPAALANGLMRSDVVAVSGDQTAADNAEAFFDGTGYAGTGNTIPTVTTVASVTSIATNGITAGSIATDAIGSAELAATAITEIQTGLATASDLTLVKAVTDKIDTAVELDGAVYRFTLNSLELAPTGGSAPTAAAIRAEIDANSTQLAAIVVDTNDIQGRLPAALTGAGNMKSDIIGISGDTTAADNLEAALDGTGGVTLSVSLTAAERTAIAVALLNTGIDATGVSARTVRQACAILRNKVTLDPTTGAFVAYDTDDTTVLVTGTGTFSASSRNAMQALDPA